MPVGNTTLDTIPERSSRSSGFSTFFGGDGAFVGYASLVNRYPQSASHVVSLLLHRPILKPSEESQDARKESDDPVSYFSVVKRRGVFALCIGLFLIPGCYFGGKFIDAGRKTVGRIVVGCCFALFWGSLILLCLSGFPWSWGWWL